MKNKFLRYIFFLIVFSQSILYANEFKIESSEIKVEDKGNLIKAKNGVKISSNDGMEITSNELIYDKEKAVLKIYGNVKINDKKNNIFTEGEEYIYYKKKEKIESVGKTNSKIKNKFSIESFDLIFDRNISEIYSQKKTKIKDLNNNQFFAKKFKLDLKTNILKAKNLTLFDNTNNKYDLNFAVVDLKNNQFLGSDIFIDFEDSIFGNNQNDPRLKAKSIISKNDEVKIFKGNFTTCNQDNEKCPPWQISANEVIHKKKDKRIEYKNAWLKIYDKPILYFPYFFHPDPTVKRQSGFLMPSFQNSNNSGTSLQIPYYKVISEKNDITFYPRLFFDNEVLLQTEYRQANKNSNLLLDFSFKKEESKTKNHFFADIKSTKQNNNLDLHLETVSNDSYLKVNTIKSSIVDDYSSLHSYLNYYSFSDNSSLDFSLEVYEDLNKNKSDRYEYIFPNFTYEKNLSHQSKNDAGFFLNTRGYNKNFNTNAEETILINDIKYLSNPLINAKIDGLQTNYKVLLRNLNSNTKNSNNFKNGDNQQLLSTIVYESTYPLIKKNKNYNKYLTPKFSIRYSPNSTKNNSNLNERLNYEQIYSLDRIDSEAVEGGESLTLGFEYSSKNKLDEDIINLSLANIFRLNENPDLPVMNGLSERTSDYIGNFEFIPSKFFDLNYEFSVDKNLNNLNYSMIKTNIEINNFITSFEFLEEDDHLNENSYLANTTKFIIDDNKSISFETSKNLDQNITSYYNLIYQYENDCLAAAIEYNKNYYTDGDLKPDENVLFSIKIIPFGKVSSPSLTK
tara:strand:+ start:2217 stop:4589 length:2373 start_codon:yes stop_codon:yes gene_type:complete